MAKSGRLSRHVERASADVRAWSSYPQQSGSSGASKRSSSAGSGSTSKQKSKAN